MESKLEPLDIKIADFTYDLPEHRIPKYPLDRRDESKLLVCKNGVINDHSFKDISTLLPKETLLVFNDSKVLPVRLHFKNSNGGKIEIFCLESISEDQNKSIWKCFVGGAAKWKEKTLSKEFEGKSITVELVEKRSDYYLVLFQWNNDVSSMFEVLEHFGQIPIPPYLKRPSEKIDIVRYQNVFAHTNGSVAAPTAGLHFTDELISKLKQRGIKIDFVTLHVGAGTFKPVKSETIGGHEMHVEKMVLTKEFVEQLLEQVRLNKKVTAVGTTTLRTLESLFWLGCKIHSDQTLTPNELKVEQWAPYQKEVHPSAIESLNAIKSWLLSNNMDILTFKTKLLILPSYKFRIIDCLITNFHQPKSTLLLLVAAAIGKDWENVYQHALDKDYRFLSYGDSSLLFLQNK